LRLIRGSGYGVVEMSLTALRLPIATLVLPLLATCSAIVDRSKHEAEDCEVHRRAMPVEVVDVASAGWSGYDTRFSSAMRDQFPHHGRLHYPEDHVVIYGRKMRIHVCSECTKAYDRWMAVHRRR
jgi:hypothetical protein